MLVKFSLSEIKAEMDAAVEKIRESKTQQLLSNLKDATPVDTGKARDGWEIKGKDIVNTVPYIDELNKGSSKQAPPLFIESAVIRTPGVSINGAIATSPTAT